MKDTDKWRPSLTMITVAMMAAVLLLPLAGIGVFRFFENHLIRSTEGELISQSAAIAATVGLQLQIPAQERTFGKTLPAMASDVETNRWKPIIPKLNLATDSILDQRGPARPTQFQIAPAYSKLTKTLNSLLSKIQQSTLAGFRILDANGTVVAGRDEIGFSLAHLPAVQTALAGQYGSTLRKRQVKNPQPIYSISRGTAVRVMTAFPIIIDQKLIGVVYASRTPSNILKEVYNQRLRLMAAAGLIILISMVLGFVFLRSISGPIRELTKRTKLIGEGKRSAIRPLHHHGSRELHMLSKQLLQMARKLVDRSDYINTFASHVTHELKSPLSSIRGAVELLSDGEMSKKDHARFLSNIGQDIDRMTLLIDRLRNIAHAENVELGGTSDLVEIAEPIQVKYPNLAVSLPQQTILPISAEASEIIFSNLIENASQNGATEIAIDIQEETNSLRINVSDNGTGIPEGNKAAVFDMFFTTRRDAGGTGMGLGIVRAILLSHDGDIQLAPSSSGARFKIQIPTTK